MFFFFFQNRFLSSLYAVHVFTKTAQRKGGRIGHLKENVSRKGT